MFPVRSPHPSKLYLIDGPIMETAERRQTIVLRMAEVLMAFDAWHNVADARLTLLVSGYSTTEVHCLLEDAMAAAGYEAQHEAVAKVMSRP